MKKVLAVFMAVVVVCNVYVYGAGERFSFEKYINQIVGHFQALPSIQGLIDIWSGEENAVALAVSNSGSDNDIALLSDSEDPERTGFFDKVKGFLQDIVELIKGIGNFIVKAWDSVLYVVNMIAHVFGVLPCLLPWNAAVPIE